MYVNCSLLFKLFAAPLLVFTMMLQAPIQAVQSGMPIDHELILYELSEETLALPVSAIPYYREGAILYLDDLPAEERPSWLNSPLDVTAVCCRNLYSASSDRVVSPQSPDAELVWNDAHTAILQISLPDGLQFTRLPDRGKNKLVEIIVPHPEQQDRPPDRYTITLTNPPDAPTVLFIQSITLHVNEKTGGHKYDLPSE